MFKIGDFSKLCMVPVSALRYYADIGLLEPMHIDSMTGYRYYDLDQLPRLNRILALKDLGLPLNKIAQALADDISTDEMNGMLRLKEAELEQELSEVQSRLLRVRTRLTMIAHEGKSKPLEVVIKSIEAQPILSIRQVIPTSQYVEDLLRESAMVVMGNQVQLTSPPMTIFHDSEFKEIDMDVEIAFPVSPKHQIEYPLEDGRSLKIRELEAVPSVAVAVHIGDFNLLAETYTSLGRWIDLNDYQITGRPREIYLRPPEENQPAMTEIQMPIERNA